MIERNEGIPAIEPLAVFETIASLDELREHLGALETPCDFRIDHCIESPYGYRWYHVAVDIARVDVALATARLVLEALLHLADRGKIGHFRIVSGAALLRAGSTGEKPR